MNNATLKSWIMTVTGYDTDHVNQEISGGPRMVGDYAVFKQIADTGELDQQKIEKAEPGDPDFVDKSWSDNRDTRVSVHVFADDGQNKLMALSNSWKRLDVRKIFGHSAILRSSGGVTLVPTTGDISWRPHYQQDFMIMNYLDPSIAASESVEAINAVDIDGKANTDSGDEIPLEVVQP